MIRITQQLFSGDQVELVAVQPGEGEEDQELALQEHMTKETRGANLGQIQDDRKSFAATEKNKIQEDDEFFDIKNQNKNIVDFWAVSGASKLEITPCQKSKNTSRRN